MSTPVPTTGWSSTVSLTAGARFSYTAVPGTGGSMRVQWTDGTNWYDFTNSNITQQTTSLVPAAATGIRAQAFSVAGTIDTENADALYPSYLGEVANEAAMLALTGVIIGQQIKRTDTGSNWQLDAQPASDVDNWREIGLSAAEEADILVGNLPQFGAIKSVSAWKLYEVTATGTVIIGPCIVRGFRCAVVGSIADVGVYDATSATGTNLMPLGGAPSANTEYGFAGVGGILFNNGLHVVVTGAGGTLLFWALPQEV